MPKTNEPRSATIIARVTPEEKILFQERCQNAGLSTSDYIRLRCLDMTPLRKRRKRPLDEQALAVALGQLMRVGNNVNQMAHALNIAKSKPDALTVARILEGGEVVIAQMKSAILESRDLIRQSLLPRDSQG